MKKPQRHRGLEEIKLIDEQKGRGTFGALEEMKVQTIIAVMPDNPNFRERSGIPKK